MCFLIIVMNFNDRIIFYLGTDKNIPHPRMNESNIDDLTLNVNTHDVVYDKPLKKIIKKMNYTDMKFSFCRGDVITGNNQHNWSLSKNRCEGNTSAVILKLFNEDRHWDLYYNKPKDKPFEKKKNKVFWRGVSTGCSSEFHAKKWNPRKVNRFTLVEKWYNKKDQINVGFSFIHRNWLKKKYSRYVKGKCEPSEFLKNKYILSVEGNDKDSGLNWKLNSNSVVLMPRPRVTSWLMETTLIPNYHYVLIKDDFSDLYEKFIWCEKNQEKCQEIIKNANEFMNQFHDRETEKKLELEVLKKYFELKSKLE